MNILPITKDGYQYGYVDMYIILYVSCVILWFLDKNFYKLPSNRQITVTLTRTKWVDKVAWLRCLAGYKKLL